jgi:hypothetical protein
MPLLNHSPTALRELILKNTETKFGATLAWDEQVAPALEFLASVDSVSRHVVDGHEEPNDPYLQALHHVLSDLTAVQEMAESDASPSEVVLLVQARVTTRAFTHLDALAAKEEGGK